MRSVGRGRRTIEVVYHQYGAARARKMGKQSMTSHRRERGGLMASRMAAPSRGACLALEAVVESSTAADAGAAIGSVACMLVGCAGSCEGVLMMTAIVDRVDHAVDDAKWRCSTRRTWRRWVHMHLNDITVAVMALGRGLFTSRTSSLQCALNMACLL